VEEAEMADIVPPPLANFLTGEAQLIIESTASLPVLLHRTNEWTYLSPGVMAYGI